MGRLVDATSPPTFAILTLSNCLIQRICRVVFPAPSLNNSPELDLSYRERRHRLISFAKTCRRIHSIAQPVLAKTTYFDTSVASDQLVQFLFDSIPTYAPHLSDLLINFEEPSRNKNQFKGKKKPSSFDPWLPVFVSRCSMISEIIGQTINLRNLSINFSLPLREPSLVNGSSNWIGDLRSAEEAAMDFIEAASETDFSHGLETCEIYFGGSDYEGWGGGNWQTNKSAWPVLEKLLDKSRHTLKKVLVSSSLAPTSSITFCSLKTLVLQGVYFLPTSDSGILKDGPRISGNLTHLKILGFSGNLSVGSLAALIGGTYQSLIEIEIGPGNFMPNDYAAGPYSSSSRSSLENYRSPVFESLKKLVVHGTTKRYAGDFIDRYDNDEDVEETYEVDRKNISWWSCWKDLLALFTYSPQLQHLFIDTRPDFRLVYLIIKKLNVEHNNRGGGYNKTLLLWPNLKTLELEIEGRPGKHVEIAKALTQAGRGGKEAIEIVCHFLDEFLKQTKRVRIEELAIESVPEVEGSSFDRVELSDDIIILILSHILDQIDQAYYDGSLHRPSTTISTPFSPGVPWYNTNPRGRYGGGLYPLGSSDIRQAVSTKSGGTSSKASSVPDRPFQRSDAVSLVLTCKKFWWAAHSKLYSRLRIHSGPTKKIVQFITSAYFPAWQPHIRRVSLSISDEGDSKMVRKRPMDGMGLGDISARCQILSRIIPEFSFLRKFRLTGGGAFEGRGFSHMPVGQEVLNALLFHFDGLLKVCRNSSVKGEWRLDALLVDVCFYDSDREERRMLPQPHPIPPAAAFAFHHLPPRSRSWEEEAEGPSLTDSIDLHVKSSRDSLAGICRSNSSSLRTLGISPIVTPSSHDYWSFDASLPSRLYLFRTPFDSCPFQTNNRIRHIQISESYELRWSFFYPCRESLEILEIAQSSQGPLHPLSTGLPDYLEDQEPKVENLDWKFTALRKLTLDGLHLSGMGWLLELLRACGETVQEIKFRALYSDENRGMPPGHHHHSINISLNGSVGVFGLPQNPPPPHSASSSSSPIRQTTSSSRHDAFIPFTALRSLVFEILDSAIFELLCQTFSLAPITSLQLLDIKIGNTDFEKILKVISKGALWPELIEITLSSRTYGGTMFYTAPGLLSPCISAPLILGTEWTVVEQTKLGSDEYIVCKKHVVASSSESSQGIKIPSQEKQRQQQQQQRLKKRRNSAGSNSPLEFDYLRFTRRFDDFDICEPPFRSRSR